MENQEQEQEQEQEHESNPLVDTFCEITSSSREEAQFFLESHNFDLDSAISTFLETSSSSATTTAPAATVAAVPTPQHNSSPVQSPTQSQSYSPSTSASSSPSRSRSPSPPPHLRSVLPNSKKNNKPYNLRSRKPMAASSNKKGSSSKTGRIRTLSDLNRRDKDSSDSDDDYQEYYTGGEKSGMLVQDPSKVTDVDAIFNQARQSGAVEGGDHFPRSSASRSFTGTARLLSGETVASASQQPEVVTHNIVFWANGFTVDDGPLLRLDDPANASFLESIRKSECPEELEPAHRRTTVHVNLTRKEENFPVTERCRPPFQGMGRTLSSNNGDTLAKPDNVANSQNISSSPPPTGLVVDQNLPSTSIQIRLADGTRMVSRFNNHHTIRDIRSFIDSTRPGEASSYGLQTVGFPPKQLTDLDQTIEQAGLANSVVIQKL